MAAAAAVPGRLAQAKASQPSTAVNFPVPPNACDCHTHIFGDPAKFPFWPGRAYTPEIALPDEMTALHQKLHMARVVIVTPSVYGTDNSATLYGMKARGKTARGIAVIDDQTPQAALEQMAKDGIRGVRMNLMLAGQNDPAAAERRLRASAERIKGLGWHIQIFTSLAMIAGMKTAVRNCPVPVVFDHFGGANAALGPQQEGFGDLLDLLASGKVYVKISGAYRAST